MPQQKKKMWIAICAICAAGALLGSVYALRYFMRAQEDAALLRQLQNQQASSVTSQADPASSTVESPVIPIDFEALWEINPEIYAWVQLPGAEIDLPVIQSATSNDFYIRRTIQGEHSIGGSIFTENYNAKDFTDFNTILYGHDMPDGTMFGNLYHYLDKSFFEENNEIIIYTPEKILKYQIFAAYVTDTTHQLLSYDFTQELVRTAYLNRALAMRTMTSNVDNNVPVTEADRILTLSTCYENGAKRLLVQGVLLKDEA